MHRQTNLWGWTALPLTAQKVMPQDQARKRDTHTPAKLPPPQGPTFMRSWAGRVRGEDCHPSLDKRSRRSRPEEQLMGWTLVLPTNMP